MAHKSAENGHPSVTVGIDLGTTNSSIAILRDGVPEVLTDGDDGLVPSCVGVDSAGKIIVGREARNQAVLFPERTVVSIKRRMGTGERIPLGDKEYTPQEISAFILRYLVTRADKLLGKSVSRVVITVPAYFTDAQRKATREAGQLAGLEVERILNEPTAASLVYEAGSQQASTVLVYDLGGGTFDVSVVASEQGVVEVLATAGNNRLGGDDFDSLIVERLNKQLDAAGGKSLRSDRATQARLRYAAEEAKKRLSTGPYTSVEEDNLGMALRKPVNLSCELTRHDFEQDIERLLAGTLRDVDKALRDAGVRANKIDRVLLVGGSTRIPRVADLLEKRFRKAPDGSVDPDRCVALGAALHAGLIAGEDVRAVLVDITPYTFGTQVVGDLNGLMTHNKFLPVIPRNSKLPVTKSELLSTLSPAQSSANFVIYQGEDPDIRNNTKIASVTLTGLNQDSNAFEDGILLRYKLNLDGILEFSARERVTGRAISGRIEDVLAARPDIERGGDEVAFAAGAGVPEEDPTDDYAEDLVRRAREALDSAPEEDAKEVRRLLRSLSFAKKLGRRAKADEVAGELAELLFFLE